MHYMKDARLRYSTSIRSTSPLYYYSLRHRSTSFCWKSSIAFLFLCICTVTVSIDYVNRRTLDIIIIGYCPYGTAVHTCVVGRCYAWWKETLYFLLQHVLVGKWHEEMTSCYHAYLLECSYLLKAIPLIEQMESCTAAVLTNVLTPFHHSLTKLPHSKYSSLSSFSLRRCFGK